MRVKLTIYSVFFFSENMGDLKLHEIITGRSMVRRDRFLISKSTKRRKNTNIDTIIL